MNVINTVFNLYLIFIDSQEKMTHRKLKDLHFADEDTRGQLPDIKNLEFPERRLQKEMSGDSTDVMETEDTVRQESQRSRIFSNKRSIDECDDDDLNEEDDASSLATSSASNTSVTSDFRRMKVSIMGEKDLSQ